MFIEEKLTSEVIGAAIEAHRQLGPGLLESTYQSCLAKEFDLRRIAYVRELPLPVEYKGMEVDTGYRLDFVVEEKVVLEIKAVEKTLPVHEAQLLTYLKLSKYKVGLLINFNVKMLKTGIMRRVV